MKLAIAYSTKDQVELTEQTILPLLDYTSSVDIHWVDGSTEASAQDLPCNYGTSKFTLHSDVRGGADAAIAYKLSKLLNAPNKYSYIGLLENDVLLAPGWLEDTMALFEKGKANGLEVGAVSPRSYVDRVLIQRDGHAVMHNIGAGAIIFTRQAAEIVLRSFRTHWWPDNVRLFAQVSGIDLRTYACFRGNEQFVTTDWGFETQLARHGLASLALTPAKVQMIGQVPPLEQQGLELTTSSGVGVMLHGGGEPAFDLYRNNLAAIREHRFKLDGPNVIHRDGAGMLFFPHQLGYLAGGPTWQGTLELKNSQGLGPFAYRAGPGGASLSVRISGSCSFLITGGTTGGKVAITDTRSGFNFAPELPANMDQLATINVPGGPVPRRITCEMAEGTVFYGLQTTDPQLLDSTFKFSWDQLPEAK